MPVISVARDDLFQRIGLDYNTKPNVPSEEADDKFGELCFQYGVELDDVTSENIMLQKEKGSTAAKGSDVIIYKIEVPANRYDLLCMEGFSRAIRIFLGKEGIPNFQASKAAQLQRMIVKKETAAIRPFVVCAVLRNLKFNPKNYESFIDLQDKLHQNICRKRTLVSIGTHDLDTIKGPFTYEALAPADINFVALNCTKSMNGNELMEHLKDGHLKKYLSIIKDAPQYPVIYDSNRVVLSLPPIINGEHSKITLDTKNVFIEVTATDLTKAQVTLNVMCAMFSEYCQDKFSVEPVEIVDPEGNVVTYPNLSSRVVESSVHDINSGIGAKIECEKMVDLLSKMSLPAQLTTDKDTLQVSVPCTRSDILHACDIMEDVAIAFGYNNLAIEPPKTQTVGMQQPLNKLSDMLRHEIAMAGYTEALTMALCGREENYQDLNRPDDMTAVTIANPKTREFQIARTTLLVGILKTINHNRTASLPIKIFEISDVVMKTDKTDVGAHNRRNLCAVNCSHTSGFEFLHGLLDRIMMLNRVVPKQDGVTGPYYQLKSSEDPTFLPGLRADIYLNEHKIGVIGVVHPNVLNAYHIQLPCSALELFIEPFV